MLILMVFSMLILSVFLFSAMRSAYHAMYYDKFKETMTIAASYIEYELDKISETALYLSTDEILQSYLRIMRDSEDDYERSLTRDRIEDLLFNQAFNEPYLALIELNLLKGEQIAVGREKGSFPSMYDQGLEQTEKYREGRDAYYRTPRGFLVSVRQMRDITSLDFFALGTMLVYVDVNRLIDKFKRQIPYYSELHLTVLIDGDFLTRRDSGRLPEDLDLTGEGYDVIGRGEDRLFVALIDGKREGWRYLGYTSLASLARLNRRIWLLIFLSHGLVSLGLIFGGRHYVKRFTSPLELLSRELHAFELNQFDIALPPPPSPRKSSQEIIDLYKDVDLALNKIRSQVYEDYLKQMALQKTRLRMLRSQINPHFLYNTLDSISWLAKGAGDRELAAMVLSLGRLLRHSLSEKRERIPLRDELAILEDYLAIQKIRFQDLIRYEARIDEACLDRPVLPFLLQPLIENSIKYGPEERGEPLELRLTAWDEGGALTIRLCDGGRLQRPGGPGAHSGNEARFGHHRHTHARSERPGHDKGGKPP